MATESYKKGIETRQKILDAIIKYYKMHGYAPTCREIGDITGLRSSSAVYYQMMAMKQEGMLESDAEFNAPRAIRVPGYEYIRIAEKNVIYILHKHWHTEEDAGVAIIKVSRNPIKLEKMMRDISNVEPFEDHYVKCDFKLDNCTEKMAEFHSRTYIGDYMNYYITKEIID